MYNAHANSCIHRKYNLYTSMVQSKHNFTLATILPSSPLRSTCTQIASRNIFSSLAQELTITLIITERGTCNQVLLATVLSLIFRNFFQPVVMALILATGTIAVASSPTNLTTICVSTKENSLLKIQSN